MKKNEFQMPYMIGTENQEKWKNEYYFYPRGIGFFEPGVVALDDPAMSTYNIAKSSYQIRPDVFNMEYLSKSTGMGKKEIIKRMHRMYDERLIMYVSNGAVQVSGFGLYYIFVKLKKGTSTEVKTKLSQWFQNVDDICTGSETTGDFDFYIGSHMRTLDNLIATVIDPWKNNPQVEQVRICPIRRDIRECHVNLWDAPADRYRELYWGEGQIEKLAEIQDKMDANDLAILKALNTKRPVEDIYDFKVLSEVSGLDAKKMAESFKEIVEVRRINVPLFALNYSKLNLTNHMFAIRLFQTTPSFRKSQITDELSTIGEFNHVHEFSDAYYDILVYAYNEISDIDALRSRINSYSEVEDIDEGDITRRYRRWTCRLDDQNDFWEECVFTDDLLQDRTLNKNPHVILDEKEGK